MTAKPVASTISTKSFVNYCFSEMRLTQKRDTVNDSVKHLDSGDIRERRMNINDSYLTPRETQCVQHLLLGKKYQEIAESLGLSKRTVEFYMKNIMKKFNCPNKKSVKEYFSSDAIAKHLAR